MFFARCSQLFFDGLQRKQLKRGDNQPTSIGQLSLFKEGVQPEWEDPAHKKGMYLEIRLKGIFSVVCRQIYLKLVRCLLELCFVLEGVFTAGTRKRWAHFSLVTTAQRDINITLPARQSEDKSL